MRKRPQLNVTIGTRGYLITECAKDFEYPDLPGKWYVLAAADRYILCNDRGKHLTFLEFVQSPTDSFILYKGREWERRPRNDNTYTLIGHKRYHGIRMPAGFSQALKKTLGEKGNPELVKA